MILKSIILLISYFQILGFGYFVSSFFNLNFRNLSKIFLLGNIFPSIILQIHYIYFPINFKFTFIYPIISLVFFIYFHKISEKYIKYFKDKKLISIFFILIFILLQSTSFRISH